MKCEIEEIRPRINHLTLMIIGLNAGNLKLLSKPENFDNVILCGPIWMGKLIVPLKNFLNKHLKQITRLVFVTSCGSTFEGKNEKFGHNLVFNTVIKIMCEKCIHCEAFPIGLVLTDEQRKDPDADIKYHLNDDNFKGEIVAIYDNFIHKLRLLHSS